MSILINDMEMPDVCADCDFCIETEDDHKCSRTKENLGLFAFELTRGMNCPLGPVPPHGRLIDGDALEAQCDDPYWCVWLSEIEDAPTIIPASE